MEHREDLADGADGWVSPVAFRHRVEPGGAAKMFGDSFKPDDSGSLVAVVVVDDAVFHKEFEGGHAGVADQDNLVIGVELFEDMGCRNPFPAVDLGPQIVVNRVVEIVVVEFGKMVD